MIYETGTSLISFSDKVKRKCYRKKMNGCKENYEYFPMIFLRKCNDVYAFSSYIISWNENIFYSKPNHLLTLHRKVLRQQQQGRKLSTLKDILTLIL